MKVALFGILLPVVASIPVLNVDIHITDDTHVSNSPGTSRHLQHVFDPTPDTSPATMSEQIPGWVFVQGDIFKARIHGNTFWYLTGKLDEKLPIDEVLFDPLIFTLNQPNDFEGRFKGTAGRGQLSLEWDSGATISGRGPGDFEFKGKSSVGYE